MAPFGDAVGLVARSEVRSRWWTLLGLALLVAVVATVSFSALGGARRTASALDRFVEATQARDARVNVTEPPVADELRDLLEEQPFVEEQARVFTLVFGTGGGEFLSILSSPDPEFQSTVDRPLVMDGRMPMPGSTREIAIDEQAQQEYDLEPGDQVITQTMDPENLACAIAQTCPLQLPDGPEEALVVTGVYRDADAFVSRDVSPEASAPASFFAEYGDRTGVLGAEVQVRLTGGADDIDRLNELVSDEDVLGIVIDAENDYIEAPADAIAVQSATLVVFALVTGLAGAAIVAQALTRHLNVPDRALLLAELGMPPRSRALGLALPAIGAGVVGLVLGALGAGLLSGRFPVGQVRRIEPDPGLRPDHLVLVAGGLLGLAALAAWCLWRSSRLNRRASARSPRSSVLAGRLAAGGAPVTVVAGARLALEAGRGRSAVPVRSALIGAAIGISGLVAAAVVGASLDALVDAPDRWGFNWSSTGTPLDPTTLEARVPEIAARDGIDGVAIYRIGLLDLEGKDITGHALQATEGRIEHTLLDGDRPIAGDEVALGEITQRDLGVGIGDTVVATTSDGEAIDLEVVGTVVLPTIQDRRPGEGALLTFEGWEQASRSEGNFELVLRYDRAADVDDLEATLTTEQAIGFREASLPGRLDNLDEGSAVFPGLIAFFIVIGALGLLHALVTSVRRRRQTFAVWRAMGFTPGQVRRSVLTQGLLVTASGILVGVPVGLVVGRFAWAQVIGDFGVVDAPTNPVGLLIAVVPVALIAALALAAGPAWSAGRGPAAVFLRSE